MKIKLILGIICVIIGVYFIVSANNSRDTTGESIRREFTGDYSPHNRKEMVGGIVLVVLGGGLLLFCRGRK